MTIDWLVVLTPLLVLPIFLLFRFVGCGELLSSSDDSVLAPDRPKPAPPTTYPEYIMGKPAQPGQVAVPEVPPDAGAVVAYWRLVDPGPVPSTVPLPAKDEKGFRNGAYRNAPAQPEGVGTSDENDGNMTIQAQSLIPSAAGSCRFYNGGHVLVEYLDGLYPDEFTIEAWVRRRWAPNVFDFEHVVFEAGGNYADPPGTPPARRGFRLWADKQNHWQFHLAPTPAGLFGSSLPVVTQEVEHVAVTVANEGGGKRVRFYVNGAEKANVAAGTYSPAVSAPLLMAVANSQNDASPDPETHRPFIGEIQEVVLHRKALSPQEVEYHFKLGKGP